MNKFALVSFVALGLISTFAHADVKDHACELYSNSELMNQTPDIQIPLITDALNVSFELNFTDDQKRKLSSVLSNIVAQDPKKMDALGNAAYFACTTDLTSDDKETGRKIYSELISK